MADDVSEEPHVFPLGRKPGEMLFCTIMLVIGGLLIAAIGWETTWLEGKRLSAQPRFWPTLSLSGVVLFAGLNWLSRSKVERTPGRWTEAGIWLRSLEFIGWYLLYVWAIPIIGYLPATVIFCTGLTLRLGYRGRAVWAAIGFALFVVLFFKSAMNVKIPGGALYQLAPEGLRYILLRYF
ncbi:MAG: tripartite tricarboxylate transporter TctB family protein [Alphaproteobacteria bacterium]|nr:tripartite tricarboxylate transporter TctB family protein [Alphaproteobacteria bacterium]